MVQAIDRKNSKACFTPFVTQTILNKEEITGRQL